MNPTPLARKQQLSDNADWNRARTHARTLWPDERLDPLIDHTTRAIVDATRCMMSASHLDYPAFTRWVHDHRPDDLTIVNTGQDLHWLAQRPHMLFPQGAHGPKWFTTINHKGQNRYYRDHDLDMLLLGRRTADGNYTGPKGQNLYTNTKGITRYSPLSAWTHEAVFALIERDNITLPPIYDWPRGYQVGTGPWPARQWTRDVDHGFEEVWTIDPDVIRHAAPHLPQAADWLARTGKATTP